MTDGGEGPCGYRCTEEQLARRREAQNRPEVRQRKSESTKATMNGPEEKQRMSVAQKEKQNRPEVKQKAGGNTHRAKPYPSFVGPDGTVYPPATNLSAFCGEHGLNAGDLCEVANGKASSHKGWKLYLAVPA